MTLTEAVLADGSLNEASDYRCSALKGSQAPGSARRGQESAKKILWVFACFAFRVGDNSGYVCD